MRTEDILCPYGLRGRGVVGIARVSSPGWVKSQGREHKSDCFSFRFGLWNRSLTPTSQGAYFVSDPARAPESTGGLINRASVLGEGKSQDKVMLAVCGNLTKSTPP